MTSPGSRNNHNQQMIEAYRANHGKVDFPLPLILLTTTGAKSGQPRTTPVAYSRDGERIVILASKGGAPTNPDWYHNILAHPDVTVELGDERFRAHATPVRDEGEYERLYTQHATEMPGFAEYRKKTTRRIPVIALERVQ